MLRGKSISACKRPRLPFSNSTSPLARVRHARTFLYYKVSVLQNLYEALQMSYLRDRYW